MGGNRFQYGTAGFRGPACTLKDACIRCGAAASAISIRRKAAVGVCLTASHNPVEDNGVKIIDSNGGMLEASWEKPVTDLVSCANEEFESGVAIKKFIQEIFESSVDPAPEQFSGGLVFIGWDSRPSGPELLQLLKRGISNFGGRCVDFGIVTTPQLHFFVHYNTLLIGQAGGNSFSRADEYLVSGTWCENDELLLRNAYGDHLKSASESFLENIAKYNILPEAALSAKDLIGPINIDAACGAGSVLFPLLQDSVLRTFWGVEDVNLWNSHEEIERKINDGCGSEHVQKKQTFPRGCNPETHKNSLWASFDGDADRLVFSIPSESSFDVLDGDYIALLWLEALMAILLRSESRPREEAGESPVLTVGLCITAYSNGGIVIKAKELAKVISLESKGSISLEVVFCSTGVKNVQSGAWKFDIGIFSESNGHNNCLWKRDNIRSWLSEYQVEKETEEVLLSFLRFFHPSVGDAANNLIAAIASLYILQRTKEQWLAGVQVLPYLQLMIPADDFTRSLIVPTKPHDMTLEEPVDLQDMIDKHTKDTPKGRAFLRPSGTEPVIRLYAESPTIKATKELANRVKDSLEEWIKRVTNGRENVEC